MPKPTEPSLDIGSITAEVDPDDLLVWIGPVLSPTWGFAMPIERK